MEDFVYERIMTPVGVKIETVTGGGHYKGKVWREIAMQIYCENGKDGYREVGHFRSGAPFLYDANERISISHTDGCLVVATLPVAVNTVLSEFSEAAALGVDVERIDREKVMRVRERFLNDKELGWISEETVEQNIIAWTLKEAALKAGMDSSIDFRNDISIVSMPKVAGPLDKQTNVCKENTTSLGMININLNGEEHTFPTLTWRLDDYVISIAVPMH